jgi:hypothetical protein
MHSHNPRGWVDKSLFKLMLSALGMGLVLACRLSDAFRRQVTRDLTIQIGSADGVFHHYVFAPRTVISRAGTATAPTLNLCFDNARQGWLALVSPHTVGKIVHALLEGHAEYSGNAVLLLWFYGLTRFVLPIGRTKPLAIPLPEAYVAPATHGNVAGRIVREPPATELDPNWNLAHRQRAKMAMIRGSAGESVPMW